MVPVKSKEPGLGDEYGTPKWVWEPWHEALNFVIDAAASKSNYLPFEVYWIKKDDSLNMQPGVWAKAARDLGGSIWLNPPYSRAAGPLEKWVQKCIDESRLGATICALLPADTSTKWFSLVWDRTRGDWREGVRGWFTEGRVHHIHPRTKKPTKQAPNFGSLILVFDRPVRLKRF